MLVLGVGEWGVSHSRGEIIKTLSLGSCVAVICSDVVRQIAGMVHVALPDSSLAKETVVKRPGYCADTGIEILFQALLRLGCPMRPGQVQVKLVGGATILDPHGTFNIGKRNVLAIKKLLWAKGLGPMAEEVGGHISRTVSVAVDTGLVHIQTPGQEPRTL
jgi:chemotaxis protein CheD